MRIIAKQFTKYLSIGVLNTLIHWMIFFALTYQGLAQALANLAAFIAAVTFSFFANSRYTFTSTYSISRYLLFTSFMGLVAYTFGALGDYLALPALVTLVSFSACSLIIGFVYSKFIVFKEEK